MSAWLFFLCSLFAAVTGDIDSILLNGSKFFHRSDGTQFYIKGIHYAPYDQGTSSLSEVDLLATTSVCERGIPVLHELGVNTIGLLHVDGATNHDHCMGLLQDSGIYVLPFLQQLNTIPMDKERPSWNTEKFSQMTAIVDAFASYDNVIAFMFQSGNSGNSTEAAYAKAIVRDVKAYIASKSYRSIPVGYATDIITTVLEDQIDYFNCDSEDDSADFFGVQSYGWCGNSSLEKSGWDKLNDMFEDYSMPVIMSEYGCTISGGDRIFTDVTALYGPDMTDIWSGGLLYAYSQSPLNYDAGWSGLVNVTNQKVTKGDAFTTFSSRLAAVTPTTTSSDSYTPTNTEMRACPTTDSIWRASSNLPPQPDEQYCDCTAQHSMCQIKGNMSSQEIANFTENTVCEDITEICAARSDPATGKYELYSMCNASVIAAVLTSNFTEQKRGDVPSGCAQVYTSTIVTSNPTYVAAGTCATHPIYDHSLPTGDSDNNSDDNGTSRASKLGGSTIAGIVIGCLAGVAIVVLAILFAFRRRRKVTTSPRTDVAELPPDKQHEKAELPAAGCEVVELQGEMPSELHANSVIPAELPGTESAPMKPPSV